MFGNADIYIENIHMPFNHINEIWNDSLDGQDVFQLLSSCITDCKIFEFPVSVMHTTLGFSPPLISKIGMKRVKTLVEQAEKSNTVIAIENLRRNDYLDHIFSEIQNPSLGFCYDSGHDLLYNQVPYAIIDKYANKLSALHLHDNNKECDAHLVPGEGIIDWSVY